MAVRKKGKQGARGGTLALVNSQVGGAASQEPLVPEPRAEG